MASDGLTPELLLKAYAAGVFPMADARDDPEVFWVDPRSRGIFPLTGFHVSRSLRRRILRGPFQVTLDRAFADVVRLCSSRPETWISHRIEALYIHLFAMGRAHSVEVWKEGRLVGGVYGVAIGGAFFGESMFSRETDASKIALCYLVDRLRNAGFTLFDTQFITPHLASLGAVEISRDDYHRRLGEALNIRADFDAPGPLPSPQALMQRMTHTS
jgi:leucyl/phenylalanyl-tRNA--protein transferase